jgi:hypothetical protein
LARVETPMVPFPRRSPLSIYELAARGAGQEAKSQPRARATRWPTPDAVLCDFQVFEPLRGDR